MDDFEFSEQEYLAFNPDVAEAVRLGQFSSGREHYERYGKQEGRLLRGEPSREEKALHLVDRNGLGLEIGPSHNPIAPKSKGFNVHILDHADCNELKRKYAGHGVNLDNIEEVDFVWSGQSLHELIGDSACYDWIIASHVIEHVPDFIGFLQQCELLLKPKGVLSLVVPDKRYCFDYFNATTTTGALLDAWQDRRTRPSPGQVFDHMANAVKRDGTIAWNAFANGTMELVHSIGDAKAQWERAQATEEYIDVHCWRFTPMSFQIILADLQVLCLTTLGVAADFDTTGCEFYLSLKKGIEPRSQGGDRLGSLLCLKDEVSS